MEIARNAGTFLFNGALAFGALALANFLLKLSGALFDLPSQQGDPAQCQYQHGGQNGDNDQQPLEGPPRWLCDHADIRRRIEQNFRR